MKTIQILLIATILTFALAHAHAHAHNHKNPSRSLMKKNRPHQGSRRLDTLRRMEARKLKLNGTIKSILRGVAKFVITGVIDCVWSYVKGRLGAFKFLAKLPVAKAGDQLVGKLKTLIINAVYKLIDGLRRARNLRRRRQLWGWNPIKAISHAANDVKKAATGAAKAVGKAASGAVNAVKKTVINVEHSAEKLAKQAATNVVKAAKDVGNFVKKAAGEIQKVAIQLDGLTGGKLSDGLIKLGCPLVVKAVHYAVDAGLKAFGWQFGLPTCIDNAIIGACQDGVKKLFKKMRTLRRLGYLKKEVPAFV